MSHAEQKQYCTAIVNKFKEKFVDCNALDCGSLDINGNNRFMFTNSKYIGIDVGKGRNVDEVSLIHEYDKPDETFDVIVSTECFEHDMYVEKSLKNIVRLLKSDGLFVFTCATTGRGVHGTATHHKKDAPLLQGEWANYYKNLTEADIMGMLEVDTIFKEYKFGVNTRHADLQFWGIKK